MTWLDLALPNASVRIWRGFLKSAEASHLMMSLLRDVPWRQDHLQMYGRSVAVPRQHQWYAKDGQTYTWSKLTMQPAPMLDDVDYLLRRVSEAVDTNFRGVLINLYRTGENSVGWHADDEADLGPNPMIASLSLGVERDFQMRSGGRRETIALRGGDLLVMAGETQKHWQHSLPKRKRCTEPRINLTFRSMK